MQRFAVSSLLHKMDRYDKLSPHTPHHFVLFASLHLDLHLYTFTSKVYRDSHAMYLRYKKMQSVKSACPSASKYNSLPHPSGEGPLHQLHQRCVCIVHLTLLNERLLSQRLDSLSSEAYQVLTNEMAGLIRMETSTPSSPLLQIFYLLTTTLCGSVWRREAACSARKGVVDGTN